MSRYIYLIVALAGLCFGQSGPWITEKGMPDWWVKVHGQYLEKTVECAGCGVIPAGRFEPIPPTIHVVPSEPGIIYYGTNIDTWGSTPQPLTGTYVAAWQDVDTHRVVFATQQTPISSAASMCGKVNADGTVSPTNCSATPISGPTASFSPQGAKVLETLTGKRIQGVGIDDVVICSPTGAPVQAGTVYQVAVNHGISPISPALAVATLRDTVSKNWRGYLIAGGGAASLALPVLGQAGVISMSSRFVVALLGGHLFFDQLKSQLQARIPDPSPVLGMLLDPNSLITFTGTCKESAMITRYTSKVPVSGTFSLGGL